jgi:hypothetical protein
MCPTLRGCDDLPCLYVLTALIVSSIDFCIVCRLIGKYVPHTMSRVKFKPLLYTDKVEKLIKSNSHLRISLHISVLKKTIILIPNSLQWLFRLCGGSPTGFVVFSWFRSWSTLVKTWFLLWYDPGQHVCLPIVWLWYLDLIYEL